MIDVEKYLQENEQYLNIVGTGLHNIMMATEALISRREKLLTDLRYSMPMLGLQDPIRLEAEKLLALEGLLCQHHRIEDVHEKIVDIALQCESDEMHMRRIQTLLDLRIRDNDEC